MSKTNPKKEFLNNLYLKAIFTFIACLLVFCSIFIFKSYQVISSIRKNVASMEKVDYGLRIEMIRQSLTSIDHNTEDSRSAKLALDSCINEGIESNRNNAEAASAVILYCIGNYLAE